jgi:hypothetical protein
MHQWNRLFPREVAKLTLAIAMVGTLATAAAATVDECKAKHDAQVNACYSDTSHMSTTTEMKYCLQRAENRYNNCINNLVDAISGGSMDLSAGDPPKRPRRPEQVITPGLLEQSPGFTPQGPSGAGSAFGGGRAPAGPSLR